MAIAMVTVFLTSCDKDITQPLNEQQTNVENADHKLSFEGLLLPADIADQSEDVIKEYLESLSNKEIEGLVNDYLIYNYYASEGLENVVLDHYNENNNLKDLNNSEYLSENKALALNDSLWESNEISGRCCYTIDQVLCKVVGRTLSCTRYIITFCS